MYHLKNVEAYKLHLVLILSCNEHPALLQDQEIQAIQIQNHQTHLTILRGDDANHLGI